MPEPLKSSLDGQFPGNSNKEKEAAKPRQLQIPELSKKPTIKKESPLVTFYRAVFSGTIEDVKKNLWNRLVEVTKDTLFNAITGFCYDYIYNSNYTPLPPQNGPTKSSLTNPDRYWNTMNSPKRPSSPYFSVPEVTFWTRADAEKVLKALIAYSMDYPNIPMSVYLATASGEHGDAERESEYTDEDWGWFSMDGVKVVPIGRKYKLTLPRPEPLPKNKVV